MILKIYHEKGLDYEFIDNVRRVRCEHNKYCAYIEKTDENSLYVHYRGMEWNDNKDKKSNGQWEVTNEILHTPFCSFFDELEFLDKGKLGDLQKVKVIIYEKDDKEPERIIVHPNALIWILNDNGKTVDRY